MASIWVMKMYKVRASKDAFFGLCELRKIQWMTMHKVQIGLK
jgi:hypothetical protein